MHLGIRPSNGTMSHLGREIFLTPIEWADEEPVVIGDRKAKIIENGPLSNQQFIKNEWVESFEKAEQSPSWIHLKKPHMDKYEWKNGCKLLHPTIISMTSVSDSPTFMAIRQPDFKCDISLEFDFAPICDGDEAGLCVYLSPEHMYRIYKKKQNGEAGSDFCYSVIFTIFTY